MNDKRYRFGVQVTLIYAVAVAIYALVQREAVLAMEPNEFGDALAGAASPLAFLWLVLGYLQQGEELKQNTQALHLQAEELRRSVEQQQRMAVTAEKQLAEMKAREIERSTPRFEFSTANTSSYTAQPNYVLRVQNLGADCQQLGANIRMPWGVTREDMHVLAYLDTWEIGLPWHGQSPTEGNVLVAIRFITQARGRLACSVKLKFEKRHDGQFEVIFEGATDIE